MIIEIQNIHRMKWSYLLRFWSYIELGLIGCSWGVLAVYIWRYRESNRISDRLKETNGYVFINLQLATYINDTLTFLLSFCCFFGTIKILYLTRFHTDLSLFAKTLQHAMKDLLSFMLMFAIVFMAFLILFYLLFIDKIWSCSTLLNTAQLLFEMMLMKFNSDQLISSSSFLGPLCFSSFSLMIVFICMTMFISIINDSFTIVRNRAKYNHNEDQEILSFMLRQFQQWIGTMNKLNYYYYYLILGLTKPNEIELINKRDEQMRAKYYEPIENFPNKIDQLFTELNHVS